MELSNDTLLGRKIDEYQIDMPLGEGGMARVYRALDTRLRRYVALKVIAPNLRANSEYTMRFEREAQSIARLDHPHIVHIYRFGESDGLYYIAMQYIEGMDVGSIINDYHQIGGYMPVEDVARVIEDIGSALDYAHSKGVIHRDVKPNNIIVNNQGQAVLTDFGLVLLNDTGVHTDSFGSPSYIAPEQAISSAKAIPQSDIYSLGVTLFQMLTGALPFTDTEPMKLAMRHVSEPPPAPSEFNKAIPAAVDQVVLRSLAKDPAQRYQSGQEFSIAFRRAVDAWQRDGDVAAPASLDRAPDSIPEFTAPVAPPVPEPQPDPVQADPAPVLASSTIPAAARPVEEPTPASGTEDVPPNKSLGWLVPVVIVGIMFGVGIIAMIIFFLATHPNNAQSLLAMPTSTPTIATTATVTPIPPTPTLQPSNTAPPPTPTAVNIAQPRNLPPPQDRNNPPANSYRLGEFAVEGFCNDRGYGVTLINNKADWACTQNNAVVYTLAPTDFDAICRDKYQSPTAFAIRDQHKDVGAYNWSCYDYQPVANNTAPQQPAPAATPSVKTLQPRYQQDWIALVNISNEPLSVQGVQFQTAGHNISAQAWNQSVLQPGACLRLYRTDQPPTELPLNCTTVFDYAPAQNERDLWFTQKVMIVINPSTGYCYPAEKCNTP